MGVCIGYCSGKSNGRALLQFVGDGGFDVLIDLYENWVHVRAYQNQNCLGNMAFSYTHSAYTLAEDINEWLARLALKAG